MLERIVYHTVAIALTILDRPFWLYDKYFQKLVRLPEHEPWSDDEIIRAVDSASYLDGTDERLVKISENTVVKFCHDWETTVPESLAMELVYMQTRIAAPRMKRVLQHHHAEGDSLIVMDFIPNSQRLEIVWPTLSMWSRLKIILTMRLYLRQIRRTLSSNVPGPISPTPLPCSGLQLSLDPLGPFPTVATLEAHYRKQIADAEYYASRGWSPSPKSKPLPTSVFTPLVFTHNDLNMRNLLLDDRGVLWIVDWGFAGFFPPWFEYLGMLYAAQKDNNPESWQHCIKYMAEPNFEVEEWMQKMGYGFHHPLAS
ncbi:hypothetical protein F5890DRAFT_1522356 [Lentinula detonsa]|uniref:Aminoglycoside phosphotransferase domain-containing protein n=1 Tax=Lentinula detonsa TaxID=2804962 RepID=A0AA38PX48_9AGAR|nr:hypothetical protein F5890DRAFT_1522356 [Lentinula detonsa]